MSKVNATRFEQIPTIPKGAKKYVVHTVIETPRDIRHKYALEPEFGILKLKETISDGLQWPYDYGFIPQTLGDDGDPLDVVFLCDAPTFPGCLVEARILGVIRLKKNGVDNDRFISCPKRLKGVAQSTDSYDDMDDLPKNTLDSLCRFLVEYSADQGNKIKFKGVESRKSAMTAIGVGMRAFKKK